MRPLTFEEREDLCRRADGEELSYFVASLQVLARRYGYSHQKLLSILLHAPRETDISKEELLWIRNKLAEEGKEFTPQETIDTAQRALCKVRNALRELGWSEDRIPDSDVELRRLICRDLKF